ncbi:MAG: Uma2 family endonuclease [Terriglobia bacterium]
MPVQTRLTYDDYCRLPDDGKRYEIIDGELFVSPSPFRAHQRVVTRLAYYLTAFLMRQGLGEVFVAPFDVVFSKFDVVEPDLLYVSKARSAVVSEKNIQGSPDLVVEVLSDSTAATDRSKKLNLYARYGVREYWIIDPVAVTAEIYRAGAEALRIVQRPARTDSLDSPLFPGFTLLLGKLAE